MLIPLLFYIFLVIQKSKAEENCRLIIPNKSSECKLSEKDKQSIFNYKYCCFKRANTSEISLHQCEPKTEAQYKTMIDKGEKCYNEENPDPKELYGCESKIPNKASDCVLSDDEKSEGYEYCCYEVIDGEKGCSLYTKKDYELGMELFNLVDDKGNNVIQCGDKDSNDRSNARAGFINLSITYFLLLILNL